MPPCPTMVQLTLPTAARPTALTATTRRLATASRSPPRDTDTDTAPKLALTDPTVSPLRALTANPTVVPKLRLPLLMPLHGRLLSRSLTTVTTPGPSRPTVKTRTPGGASLTTPSKHANTITSTTALPHLPTPRLATLLTSRRHPRARTPCTQATPRTSGMPMVAIRTSMRRPASTTPVLRPTRPSLTMSGTTTMPISGAPKLGALIRTSTVPLPTVLRPPPASTATPTPLATVTVKELRARSGRVLPHLIRLPLRVTITTRGPSRLTVRTPTPGGASLTIP